MRIRLTKIDELQFLTCLEHGLWGSRSARFKDWKRGDGLVFIVGRELAGLAEVDGDPFVSRDTVWDNGIFPHRIPIRFDHVIDRNDRIPILGRVRDVLTEAWGVRYGWGILNQQTLADDASKVILEEIKVKPNALSRFQAELAARIEEAKLEREAARKMRRPEKPKGEEVVEGEEEAAEEIPMHTNVQHLLVQLGRAAGCFVWVPQGDRGRPVSKGTLGDECIKELPPMGLNEEALRRISYIDVLWIRQNSPVSAFEIETTTSIYSGLLRMSDLLAVVPALRISLFVVAPEERQDRALRELARPTFSKLGLSEYCKFVSSEKLEDLAKRVGGLTGHIQPTIVDTIAVALEE